jgi:hypothetical protein
MANSNWIPYEPDWLIALAINQLPDESWLPAALAQCTQGCWESRFYIHFVDAAGSDWQFNRNLELNDLVEGPLILDVLVGDRIGGIEFLGRLLT